MKNYFRLGLLGLAFAAAVLALASCGGPGGDRQGGSNEGMQGMDHGGTTAAEETTGGTTGMEMGSGGMAEEMLMEDGEYSDLRFIDAMVPHHEGAVEMATVALENAEHEEVRRLAEDIISAQRAEIDTLLGLREREFGSVEPAMQMPEEEMDRMMGMADPWELANAEPFDKAFIDAMIPHHESAIAMANAALEGSDDPEIRGISRAIMEAQEKEIARMEAWRQDWYPAAA